MLSRVSSEQYTSIYEHSKYIYGSSNLLVMEKVVKFKKKKRKKIIKVFQARTVQKEKPKLCARRL